MNISKHLPFMAPAAMILGMTPTLANDLPVTTVPTVQDVFAHCGMTGRLSDLESFLVVGEKPQRPSSLGKWIKGFFTQNKPVTEPGQEFHYPFPPSRVERLRYLHIRDQKIPPTHPDEEVLGVEGKYRQGPKVVAVFLPLVDSELRTTAICSERRDKGIDTVGRFIIQDNGEAAAE